LPAPEGTVPVLGATRPDEFSSDSWRTAGDWRGRVALATPLLAWDLTVFLCGLASVWPRGDLLQVFRSVALARLAQILVDTSSWDHDPSPPPTSLKDDREYDEVDAGLLEDLRDVLCRAAGRANPRRPRTVVRDVTAAWAPFLRVASFLLEGVGVTEPLGLPEDNAAAAARLFPRLPDLFGSWGRALGPAFGADNQNKQGREVLRVGNVFDGDDAPVSAEQQRHQRPTIDIVKHDDSDDEDLTTTQARSRNNTVWFHDYDVDAPPFGLSRMPLPPALDLRFVRLPERFTDLYTRLVRGPDKLAEDTEGPALCLVCGHVVDAARRSRPDAPGACTCHARSHDDGVGIFFLVLKCATLLTFNSHAAFGPSIYLDDFDEDDFNLRRGAPLSLSHTRVRELELLYNSHGVPTEVARRRKDISRVIADDYY